MDELILEAGRAERNYWRDLWRYRELFYFLAWRDLLVRYKQTAVGVLWALIRPILTMLILTVVAGLMQKNPPGGVPRPILIFCALLPWTFFSTALSESGNSLVANSNLISKVYFPRLIVPASSVITSFVDFLISALFLVVLMTWYRVALPAMVWFLPAFVLLAFGASLGAGLWIAALMVEYRDFRVIVPFVVQFGLYASPVMFVSRMVSDRVGDWAVHAHSVSPAVAEQYGEWARLLYSLNPMVGVIDGFRWCLLGGENTMYWPGFLVSAAVVIFMVGTGIWYFRSTEKTFADVI